MEDHVNATQMRPRRNLSA